VIFSLSVTMLHFLCWQSSRAWNVFSYWGAPLESPLPLVYLISLTFLMYFEEVSFSRPPLSPRICLGQAESKTLLVVSLNSCPFFRTNFSSEALSPLFDSFVVSLSSWCGLFFGNSACLTGLSLTCPALDAAHLLKGAFPLPFVVGDSALPVLLLS